MGHDVAEWFECGWYEVETGDGIEIVLDEEADADPSLVPSGRSIHRVGWLARLTAPGYLDCTDWVLGATEAEVLDSLLEFYGAPEVEDFTWETAVWDRLNAIACPNGELLDDAEDA